MAQFLPQLDDYPLEEQLKTLGDEELLDFWEESQFLNKYLEDEGHKPKGLSNTNYEKLIVQELQIRTCMRYLIK
ncbi:hypothetical protein KFV02_04405 [Desulfohalobiaceae bacterium Ax17]|uniref:hypothetical protein n=1 Tax=Desulfovulcanus ferrireducens TaxID=2831190 RepID=UPI00207BC8CD|nr:hypothetical protein [Desulfovulcanus ferrireducens]MBT8763169.1 hypothetical protein [Desulfovulcanus ferrireducens]